MPVATWPSSLPPLWGMQSSLGTDQLYRPPQETVFDDGPSRTRRRSLYNETPRKIVVRFTRAEFAIFKAFVMGTLNNGAARFQGEVRLADGRPGLRVCKIQGAVQEKDEGPTSVVTFTLMVRDW